MSTRGILIILYKWLDDCPTQIITCYDENKLIHCKVCMNLFFLKLGIRNYEKESGRADHLNTCRISPYIHFGQISPRAILTEARHMKSPKFLRKLAWRDMSYWLLTLWPDLPSVPTRVHYRVSDLI